MVGLSVAYQLLEREIAKTLSSRQGSKVGCHGSGRNSGFAAPVYTQAWYIKSEGMGCSRLRLWIEEKRLAINTCGSNSSWQEELDNQLKLRTRQSEWCTSGILG